MIEKFNDDYDFYFEAKSNKDGLGKFLKEVNMDLSTDIRYDKIVYGYRKCVCGQPIKRGFRLYNQNNNRTCVVGKQCYKCIKDYLGWK